MSRSLAATAVPPSPIADRSKARLTPRVSRSPAGTLDPDLGVALVELLRDERLERAEMVAEQARERGADATVCAFLADDLREAAHTVAEVEHWLQSTLDVLDTPSSATLFEQATDVAVLQRLEHLFQTVDNLRRRLLQTSVGLRRGPRSDPE